MDYPLVQADAISKADCGCFHRQLYEV